MVKRTFVWRMAPSPQRWMCANLWLATSWGRLPTKYKPKKRGANWIGARSRPIYAWFLPSSDCLWPFRRIVRAFMANHWKRTFQLCSPCGWLVWASRINLPAQVKPLIKLMSNEVTKPSSTGLKSHSLLPTWLLCSRLSMRRASCTTVFYHLRRVTARGAGD